MNLDILFKFFHLFIFIFVAVYFFKKLYFQDIKNKIEEEKDNIKNLEVAQTESFLRIDISKKDTELQAQNCEILDQNIILWKNNFDKKREQKIEQVQKLRHALNRKIAYQFERYNKKKIEAEILPDVLHKLEKELYDYYSSGDNANKYMSKIVESLKKS